MRISNFLCKVSLLLAVCTLMFIAYGCTPCSPSKHDFHTFIMGFVTTFKDSLRFRKSGKGDNQFMVYRQREDTLIIGLSAWPLVPTSGPETCTRGFVHWVTSMDVVSDADWDAAHPAGTSLADIIIAKIDTPGASAGHIFKPLSKVVFDEALHRRMSNNRYIPSSIYIELYLSNPPRPGKHVFTVKVGKSNGNDFDIQSIPVIWN